MVLYQKRVWCFLQVSGETFLQGKGYLRVYFVVVGALIESTGIAMWFRLGSDVLQAFIVIYDYIL